MKFFKKLFYKEIECYGCGVKKEVFRFNSQKSWYCEWCAEHDQIMKEINDNDTNRNVTKDV